MSYALVRTTSALALSSPRPTVLLSRTYSVPDLSIYRPSLSSSYYYPYYSWRYWYPYRYRDYSLSDYSYNYPTYRSWFPYRSSYYSDYYTSPYYWNYPYSYWNRFKSYLYDYDWPYYSSRRQPTSMNCQTKYSNDPYYDSYIQSSRYRNSLLNSMEDGIHKGLALYRNGTISFDQLHRNWISSMSWHQRHKDWRQLYLWDKEQHRPSTQMEQKYTAEWVPAFNPA